MASKGGPRAMGSDGNDFRHRQQIAAHYQESVQYKNYLKWLAVPHLLVSLFLWTKVGGEILRRSFETKIAFLERIDLPSAYPWEYVWCLSFFVCFLAFMAFPKNNLKYINYFYYGHFLMGIVPCMMGLGGQLPELFDYIFNSDSQTPTFKGTFPMVIIWYIFFLIALQIHVGAMYCASILARAWSPIRPHSD
ncbi:unnamed protein product, partial [Mesorhabditis belari]|uniref:Uncharacterized protein n=1 Tax=Mesorhabditis belari TaxID=2138241 RepID=A0AAF3F517_9BILA